MRTLLNLLDTVHIGQRRKRCTLANVTVTLHPLYAVTMRLLSMDLFVRVTHSILSPRVCLTPLLKGKKVLEFSDMLAPAPTYVVPLLWSTGVG